jgi:hypothetical protein
VFRIRCASRKCVVSSLNVEVRTELEVAGSDSARGSGMNFDSGPRISSSGLALRGEREDETSTIGIRFWDFEFGDSESGRFIEGGGRARWRDFEGVWSVKGGVLWDKGVGIRDRRGDLGGGVIAFSCTIFVGVVAAMKCRSPDSGRSSSRGRGGVWKSPSPASIQREELGLARTTDMLLLGGHDAFELPSARSGERWSLPEPILSFGCGRE